MGTTLILAGVMCMIAAIVGGGIKFHNMEVGSIQSLWRQILLGVFGALIGLVGGTMHLNPSLFGQAASEESAETAEATENAAEAPATENAAPAEEAAAAEAAGTPLVLSNPCGEAVNVWIAYRTAAGWVGRSDPWTLRAGFNDRIENGGVDVEPISGEIYVFAERPDGTTLMAGTHSRGGLERMMRVDVTPEEENYPLEIPCS